MNNPDQVNASPSFNKDENDTKSGFFQNQPPKPEPRKKSFVTKTTFHTTTMRADNDHDTNQQVASLVNIQHQQQVKPRHSYNVVTVNRTSLNEIPLDSVADEGVSSPTNIEYEDEDDEVDDYYDDDDEYRGNEQQDELTNLSKQSMVPLHELIAYYQYIQQGNDNAAKEPISRQSSSVSQQTTRTKHSYNDDAIERLHQANYLVIDDDGSQSRQNQDEQSDQENQCHSRTDNFNVEAKPLEEGQDRAEVVVKDKRRIRANVILELINSERDFVKHLKDVVEGYLYPARRHPEIFTGDRINTIFSNIEQLYEFQRKFLESLELCIVWDDLASSRVGNCFLEYEKGFSVYHHYCNNHPNAISELQDLYSKPRFVKFFEACRLLQNMIDISLDGFLLTPIQKICKYPLQLNELLKNTDENHLDFEPAANALESMRNCANLANERKRRIEALADVMSFQEKVENWFGPKLSDTSSVLIHSGEVSKMTSHTWSQGVQLYLFDHLLLYSKKDLLKRNNLILKGRICMDSVTEISDADEYKAKKSFKLYCSDQQKWFVFTTRSEKERNEWIKAFERERNLVESDENEGFHITEREIGVARRALQNRKHSRSARYRHKRPDTAIVDHLDLDDANSIMNRTLSLPSCIHPSHVMNFVEDSKVVSKKNGSPNASSRSPTNCSQYLSELEISQQQSSANWFKKMGSKKLARSQVYNINNSTSSAGKIQTSPINNCSDQPSPLKPSNKYDELEKKHRNHMIGEEQARLFRLNNDSSIPSFFSTISNSRAMSQAQNQPNSNYSQSLRHQSTSPGISSQVGGLDFKSLQIDNQSSIGQTSNSSSKDMEKSTFEATVVLSSGRVVRVREDTV